MNYYYDLLIHTRGIYTWYGSPTTGGYQVVTTQQYANVFPFTVFFPCDRANGYDGAYTTEYGYQGQTFTPKFKDNPYITKQAWQVFNTSGQSHVKVVDYFKGSFKWS